MNKLIIRHGERVTEHEIGDHPLVVGRDPQCDLFFADKKLSRRHARFERGGDGIRLVDLGSRNGSWVNEERVAERIVTPSDSVRLGSLSIEVEAEKAPEAGPDQESTVFLSSEPEPDDSRTMVLSGEKLPDADPDDTGTVMLAPNERAEPAEPTESRDEQDSATRIHTAGDTLGDEDPTLRKPDTHTEDVNAEQTVMLDDAASRRGPDTGTVIFRGTTAPPVHQDATRIAPPGGGPDEQDEQDEHDEAPATQEFSELGSPTDEPDEGSWLPPTPRVQEQPASALKFVGLVAAVAVLAIVVLAVPLMRTLGNALAAESSLRGRVLVDLLAASNEQALRENRARSLALERVAAEPGVVGAYILDPMGRALAPADASVDTLFEELGVAPRDIRTFREGAAADGTTVYAVPVRAQGRRLGIAVLHYRADAGVSRWTAVMVVLGSVLLLMGVSGAVLMARRWTLLPVQELRDDVESLRRGFVDSLVEDRPYSELAMIARSFNELTRKGGGSVGDGSETYKPMVDPTLVPDEPEQAEG